MSFMTPAHHVSRVVHAFGKIELFGLGLLVTMIPVALLTLATLHLVVASDTSGALRGVSLEAASMYAPDEQGLWKCLDGSKTLKWDRVNDNYCDCADGSDEPGTAACPNSTFYCVNSGHNPTTIPAWKVDDGLCEPECCDGSDEADGTCPNQCAEAHVAFLEHQAATRRILQAGVQQREKYLEYGRGSKESSREG
ncbi:glucosidase II beta subunit-like-domain-containing protein [Piptocephalis cylindrospora]|uniref:Glucosidase II beta subunit-like-domain-containing protein n=1 Tax=Piptocephalis cylindrospora TaxID=1907219 RepID=A0A4P9Y756_9FUNG|nr:glucosidase II beta subunit-like-domain-containing protein [Piptocephalis cylindrospora]|eukprot:RKP14833.1 glucosidase II beta subunit-like-domain-containing protein [Piptocephalis cylindrospora]